MAERLPPPAPSASHGAGLQAPVSETNVRKDPVFLVMFTGQIESAEASYLLSTSLWR